MQPDNPRSFIARLKENEPLAPHTAWRIGGPARYYAAAATADELRQGLAWARERELPIFLLGGGTNLLVRDSGFPGLVLHYVAKRWEIRRGDAPMGRLYADAGAPMAGTVRRLCAQGWGGLEWAEGLPGTVGGAVFGNAGCYGGDIAGTLERAWLLVGDDVQEWPMARFEYGYRTSILKNQNLRRGEPLCSPTENRIILAAEFRIHRADPAELAATIARTAAERKSKTPWGSSCGSVFKNPPGASAGRLIEQAGLKGTRIGAAEISERHANYIVNLGGASSDDVLRLIDLARNEVRHRFGVELELEVQII